MTLNLDPLHRPLWRGRTNVDQITIAALEYAETLRRTPGLEFYVTQGSYQSSVAASAGTHDRGGTVDLRWTGDDHDIWCLRAAGFAAWHRTPAQGPWPDHIHAVLVDHPYLAPSAARQVESYRDGRNGLANNGPDDGPQIRPIPVFDWPPEDDMSAYADQLDRIEKDQKAILSNQARILNRLSAQGKVRGKLDRLVAQGKATREELRDLAATLDEGEQ